MTEYELSARRILTVVTNYGVEQDELLVPSRHLRETGASVDIAAVTQDPVRTLVGDQNPGEQVRPTLALADVDQSGYDLLVIPGGTLNADALRLDDTAVDLVHAFVSSNRPVAAICHGPLLLVEAGVLKGKTLTSYASLRTDVLNAGADWVDAPVVRDDTGGWPLITSRTPRDLDDFLAEIDKALASAA
ncbi:type 1 glutamine amidotransferase domain-containing protein [Kitasatospora sp. MBT63]|uniref:type 1 glutamine amidotransferase domain-containing protein n=1 Tax=Kitasatospora sp. MBT63 TaxID=1444768 RepID=UPI00053A1075|nr:type 1 glutamine amidotransferase domain-containing protein [Kitasatospora sp. MBT63]